MQKEILSIKNNELILLNHPETIWLIQSGSLDIFAIDLENGAIANNQNRCHLFTCHRQDILLPTKPSLGQADTSMMALALNDVELLKINREDCGQLILSETATKKRIANWLNKLAGITADETAPTARTKIIDRDQTTITLTDGEVCQPKTNKIVWVKVKSGYARWLGKEEFTITPVTEAIPLNASMWLSADGDTVLSLIANSSVDSIDTLLNGFDWLHKQILYLNRSKLDKKRRQEINHIQSKQKSDFQVTNMAFQQLASPLMPLKIESLEVDDPLLTAAGAVGKALGVKINPPAKSENLSRLKEPLEAIARASRLRMRQVKLADRWWQKDCGKGIIAYTRSFHRPVAILQITPTSYELLDPVTQTRTHIDKRVAATIKPTAYIFYRSLPDKSGKIIDLIRFSFFSLRKEFLVILTTGMVVALLGMITPYATGILIDSAIPDRNYSLLRQIGLGLLLLSFSITVLSLAQGLTLLRLKTTVQVSTQAALWDKLLKLPVSFFRKYSSGDLKSRVTSVNAINSVVTGITTSRLLSSSFALLNLGLLCYYSFPLAVVAVIITLIMTVFTVVSNTILIQKIQPLLEIQGYIFGQTVQIINGISKLKVARAQKRAFAAWSKKYTEQIELELSTQNIEDWVVLVNTIVPTITTGILFAAAVALIDRGQNTGQAGLTLGTFVAFNAAFNNFINGATSLSGIVTDISGVIPLWKRSKPILETLPEVALDKKDPGKLIGQIDLKHVSFRYNENESMVLDNVNISVEPGKFIAFVGVSGSGKSTLLRLLLGFEIPETGAIYYDGQDLANLDVTAVRRQMGIVLQNSKINAGSILENLIDGTQTTIEEAWFALRLAGIEKDIQEMPMGIQTLINEGGSNLSGGQRQRLLIAKALIFKPQILLFDEATSALDNKTQAVVSKNLEELKVTRIVIAHRLSTIRQADNIYVLEAGKVVQQGKFTELAKQKGLFSLLIKKQI